MFVDIDSQSSGKNIETASKDITKVRRKRVGKTTKPVVKKKIGATITTTTRSAGLKLEYMFYQVTSISR